MPSKSRTNHTRSGFIVLSAADRRIMLRRTISGCRVMAQLRHIAISVPDPDKAATFYETVFGMTRVGTTHSPLAPALYLSHPVIHIAPLAYYTHDMSGP